MIPAKCRKCGKVFEQTILGISDSTNVNLSGIVQPCIYCGGPADVGDGVYDVIGGTTTVKKASVLTMAMFDQLRGIAEKAKDDDLDAEEILAEVAAVNPELAVALRKRSLTATILILVLIIILKTCSVETKIELDVNRLVEQAVEYHTTGTVTPAPHLTDEAATNDSKAEASEASSDDDGPHVKNASLPPEKLSRRAKRRQRGRNKK